MCIMFFSFDHPNYARYSAFYLLNMLNMEKTHPGAKDLLKNNGFGVNRSDVPSSRNAVDTEEKNVAAQPHPPTNQVQTCIFQIPLGEALKWYMSAKIPERGGRVSRSGPWTKTGLFEAITFLRDSSKYSWSRFGDLCCLHTIPQMMLLFCEEWISIHRAWKAHLKLVFFVLFCFVFFNYCLLQRFINIQATTSRG